MSEKAVLTAVGGDDAGATFTLSKDTTLIGRGSVTDVRLDAPGISVAHACIRAEPDGYWIQDVGSLNGTFVNGQRIGWELRPLQNFDRIQVRGQGYSAHWEFVQPSDSVEF